MNHLRKYLSAVLCTILCASLLAGCLPQPRDTRGATTAAPYQEAPSQEYEQYDEAKLTEQSHFRQMEKELFRDEVSTSLIDLHFSLKDPSAYGISQTQYLYAPMTVEFMEEGQKDRAELKKALDSFDPNLLDDDQKTTWRILQSYLKTEAMADGMNLYAQPLAPTIGIQAQLPILLCEYRFTQKQDVEDYLRLLDNIDEYFAQILDFEQKKAATGLMISDGSISRIIESCESYLLVPGNNFMIDTFQSRLEEVPDLTEEEKSGYLSQNAALLESSFVPAYRLLIDGMEKLKGTGTNQGGMAGYPQGKDYYRYLVFSQTGTSYSSVEDLIDAVQLTIDECLRETSALIEENPALTDSLDSYQFNQTKPSSIMEDLKAQTAKDFPALPECSYTLKDVPKALELSLSPAFYLTSPLDDIHTNVIYINNNPQYSSENLYTTIAHEGYPGHLYQTVYFHSNCSSNLRKLLSFPGYSEGWATYVEHLSYGLDNGLDPAIGQLLSANSMALLGLHAMLDLGINYLGWDRDQVRDYLSQFYTDLDTVTDTIYETMVDNPANYLSYFVGCMEFRNMRQTAERELGSRFDATAFHTFLLDMGNAPFDVIQPYFTSWLMDQKL